MRYQNWIERVSGQLAGTDHGAYVTGLEELGKILGYVAVRPKGQAPADMIWRAVFGNIREYITFDAKIEHQSNSKISYRDVGQVGNQKTRALAEQSSKGYVVRTVIATHMDELEPEAFSSLGEIRILTKDVILALWKRVTRDLSSYRARWSLDDIGARRMAFDILVPTLPPAGWLTRALATDESFVAIDALLTEWP